MKNNITKEKNIKVDKPIQENIAVYEMLREHILSNQDKRMQLTINMYIIFFAIFAINSHNNIILLFASLVIIIVFQALTDARSWEIAKASMYILVFFEEKRSDIHWELLHNRCEKYDKEYKKTGVGRDGLIKIGPLVLMCISAVYYFTSWNYSVELLKDIRFWMYSWVTVILCGIIIAQNRIYFWKNKNAKLYEIIVGFYNTANEDPKKLYETNIVQGSLNP